MIEDYKPFEVLEHDGKNYNHVAYFENYSDALACINNEPTKPRHINVKLLTQPEEKNE